MRTSTAPKGRRRIATGTQNQTAQSPSDMKEMPSLGHRAGDRQRRFAIILLAPDLPSNFEWSPRVSTLTLALMACCCAWALSLASSQSSDVHRAQQQLAEAESIYGVRRLPPASVQAQAHRSGEVLPAAGSGSRALALNTFLDEMNRQELRTVAAGDPIENLFRADPLARLNSSSTTSARVRFDDENHDNKEQTMRVVGQQTAASGEEKATRSLDASQSEHQIYSECALILQRTYVKNINEPKHQLVPFGKTEQACISYKHIDKAIEQAKHRLKFREFTKLRKTQQQEQLRLAKLQQPFDPPVKLPPPPPPFEVIHTSLEPPEDLVAAIGEINMATTQIIADQFDLSNDELLNGLPLIDMSKTKFRNLCPLLVRQDIKCEVTRFRTMTGHCNNLKHPTWGAAMTPYARYLPPVHPDGIWVPRKSIVSEVSYELGEGHRELHSNLISPSVSMPIFESNVADPVQHHYHAQRRPSHTFGGADHHIASSAVNFEQPRDPHHLYHDYGHFHDQTKPQMEPINYISSYDESNEMLADRADEIAGAGSVQFVSHARLSPSQSIEGYGDSKLPADLAMAMHSEFDGITLDRQPVAHSPQPMRFGGHAPHHMTMDIAAHADKKHQNHQFVASPSAPLVHRSVRSVHHELPSARLVSSIVHRDIDLPNHDFSMLFASWGQLLDHDMTRAAQPPATIKCCPQQQQQQPQQGSPAPTANEIFFDNKPKHKLCLPIQVPHDDPFYSKFNVDCLEFRRSLAGVRPNCVLGPRVHQNAVTAPLDANFVYGSSQAMADALRLFKGGRLRDRDWFRRLGLKPLLPAQEIEPDLDCIARPRDLFCFLAGDVRANEQTHLTVLHTVYMREHNRIADKLSELNPHWDDNRIYHEARHIVAATVQHVAVNEFIPLLIGFKMAELYNLTSSSHYQSHHKMHGFDSHHGHEGGGGLYWHGYDPTVTTSVANSFAAAAYRQGHTLVQGTIERYNKLHEFVASEKLRFLFKQPFLLYKPGVIDELISGMINHQAQSYDPFISVEIAGHLFQAPNNEFGHDLASINIQRGRDQGLPGYNLFREWCGLPRAETFEQLEPYLTNHTAFQYSKLYKHVDDIDLWSGGVSERKLPGAAVGPTFACIIARQFSNTRRGDRFWYENPNLPSSFTPEQLAEIKKITLSKILCANADDLPTIQRWALKMAHPVLNPRVECSQLAEINLHYWQEE